MATPNDSNNKSADISDDPDMVIADARDAEMDARDDAVDSPTSSDVKFIDDGEQESPNPSLVYCQYCGMPHPEPSCEEADTEELDTGTLLGSSTGVVISDHALNVRVGNIWYYLHAFDACLAAGITAHPPYPDIY